MEKKLPLRRSLNAAAFSEAVSSALRAELGDSHRAVKTIMEWTGGSEGSAKNWLAGRAGPRGAHLIELMRHSEAVLRAVLSLADLDRLIPAAALLSVRSRLTDVLALLEELAPADVEIQIPCAVFKRPPGWPIPSDTG